MIEATEKGRSLILTVGGELEFTVKPVTFDAGVLLLGAFMGISRGPLDDSDAAAEEYAEAATSASVEMSKLAVGEDNWDAVRQLRPEEVTEVTLAAFFWQVQGGGIKALRTFLEDGPGKATEAVFEAAGASIRPQSPTSPSSDSESPTR